MKYLLLILTFFASIVSILASSTVGGDLTYEKVGASSYKIQLKLYRDCTLGNLPFKTKVTIKVRKGKGDITALDFDMPLMGVNKISLPADSCSFGTCVEEAQYTKTVTLTSEPEGYHLFYVSCCRNTEIDNVINPSNTGETNYNFELSQLRARNVVGYLVSHGIRKNRVTAKGKGSSQPAVISINGKEVELNNEFIESLDKEEQEKYYQLNRRTTFKVLNP